LGSAHKIIRWALLFVSAALDSDSTYLCKKDVNLHSPSQVSEQRAQRIQHHSFSIFIQKIIFDAPVQTQKYTDGPEDKAKQDHD